MALKKDIRQEDGVTTNYHRILFIQSVINSHNSIAVLSYVDDVSRNCEKDNTLTEPYRKSITYEVPYNSAMTIGAAYDYLKTLPQFEGAVDV